MTSIYESIQQDAQVPADGTVSFAGGQLQWDNHTLTITLDAAGTFALRADDPGQPASLQLSMSQLEGERPRAHLQLRTRHGQRLLLSASAKEADVAGLTKFDGGGADVSLRDLRQVIDVLRVFGAQVAIQGHAALSQGSARWVDPLDALVAKGEARLAAHDTSEPEVNDQVPQPQLDKEARARLVSAFVPTWQPSVMALAMLTYFALLCWIVIIIWPAAAEGGLVFVLLPLFAITALLGQLTKHMLGHHNLKRGRAWLTTIPFPFDQHRYENMLSRHYSDTVRFRVNIIFESPPDDLERLEKVLHGALENIETKNFIRAKKKRNAPTSGSSSPHPT